MALAAARREAAVEPFIALPGTFVAADAAASALRAAANLRLRDLISDLESLREAFSSVSLVWRESALDSVASSSFCSRATSLEHSFSAASSVLRRAMSWSAAGEKLVQTTGLS